MKHKSIRRFTAAITALATVFSCCCVYEGYTGITGNSSIIYAGYITEEVSDTGYKYDIYTDDNESEYCIITGYSGTDTELVIPSSFTYDGNEIPVTNIKQEAFRDNTSITSVKIPEGVVSIGQKAFSGCTFLTDVSLPKSLKEIGVDAFEKCPVKGVIIASDLTDGIYAFDRDSLESVRFAEGVTTVPERLFYLMENLIF